MSEAVAQRLCATQHFALVKAREDDLDNAARLLGYVDKGFADAGFVREPTEKWGYDQLMSALRQRLNDDQIGKLGLQGSAWTDDQVIAQSVTLES
jgi:hypothetical protein